MGDGAGGRTGGNFRLRGAFGWMVGRRAERVVERMVLPPIVLSTGGFTADGGRSGWYNGRFYDGLMVERAVLLIR